MSASIVSEEYNFIFGATGDALILTDREGRLAQMNPTAAAMLGLNPDELIGKQPQEAFSKYPALAELFTGTPETVSDVRLAKQRLAVGTVKILGDGRRIVLLHDVTEQRELESRRAQLVLTIAHDLRNPLTIINGFADLIGVAGELNDDQQAYQKQVQENTVRLFDVAEELVDLAWVEAGMPFELQRMQLQEMVQEAAVSLSELAVERGISVTVSVQAQLPPVMADKRRLALLLTHLVRNALLYSQSGGSVTIRAWSEAQQVFCSVEDQGIGISNDEQDMIFDRLYRGESPEVRAIPGGGLGLTIARAIARRHGGDIQVASTLGKGSTFTFALPAASA